VGRAILCEVQAANSGGVGIGRTPALRAVKAAASTSQPPAIGGATPPPPVAVEERGGVSLAGTSITVQGGGVALVRLECFGAASCHGKLTLTARSTVKASGKRKKTMRVVTIGAASFSVPGEAAQSVRIKLNATGRALLGIDHGRVTAGLAILELAPGPAQTETKSVRLIQQRTRKRK
jgi:hypothetical protein